MKSCRFFLVLAVLCWPGAAFSAGADMDSVLNRLQEIGSRIETLSSDFTQEKYLSVFQEMLPASGRFYYRKPDQLRWELTSPVTSGFVLKGNQGRRWSQAGDAGERFDISREPVMKIVAEQLLAWTRADFDRLGTEYDMTLLTESPVTLRLDPKGGAAGFLDHLQIIFSESGGHVQQVEVHEKGGDFTRIIFHGTAINQPVADEVF